MTEPLARPPADTIAWAKPEDVGMSRERLARIGEVLEADIAAGKLPGAVALVARRGKIVHFKAYGSRDPAAADAMERDTIFRIYSMTKPIVSVAAMTLVEEGRLDLGEWVSAFIPGFATVKVGESDGRLVDPVRPVTVHDLMRHTSGLTYDWMEDAPACRAYEAAASGRRDRSNREQSELLATLPLLSQPGTRWDYGRSTDVLGRVIEVVTGLSLGEALRERVLEPLGMQETGFHVPEAFGHRMAEAHKIDPDMGEPVSLLDLRKPVAQENGGGGLASTAGDYARFLHMLVSGGTLDGIRILSPATLAWMMSDHLGPEVAIGSDILPAGYGFGLGFAIRRQDGLAAFPGSAGDAYWEGIAGTSFWVDPARRLYGLLMIQAPGRREHYRRLYRQLVYGALIE